MGFNPSTLQLEAVGAAIARGNRREPDPIGAPLEEVRRRLLKLTSELGKHLDEPAAPLLEASAKQLRQACCRIGIVGQVKAGKSTFINALVQRPDLLPADINPCTAVVTLLNFRSDRAPAEHAAVFRMFSADEWGDLADGGGALRELTQRLVPSFHQELLKAQLEFMRKRAERRLGPAFQRLLGECHRFKDITPELLADYVSAGDDYDDTGQSSTRPQFSDITRTAELHLEDGPFAFPTTLVDTPGINDPFLVRDEITRRCLENPDMFVFVMSALQPPSPADISMLRLINGLNKDRIIVFINRLDQVNDPAAEGAAIKASVEQRLRREFPALNIPVIIGSARLGNLAHQLRQGEANASPGVLEAFGVRAADPGSLTEAERSSLAAVLHQSSGMAEVASTISRLMCAGTSAILFRQIAACMHELARAAEISAKAELGSIERLIAARRMEAGELSARIAEERQSLDQLEARAGAIDVTFREIEAHLVDIIRAGTVTLRDDLQHIVRRFSESQAEALTGALAAGARPARTWICDVMPLRERLEAAYLAAFRRMAGDVTRVEGFLYPQLEVIAAKLLPEGTGTFTAPPVLPLEPIPSEPLSVKVALDLGQPWWKLFLAARPTPEEKAQHVRQLIKGEFFPVTEALVRLAETRLAERATHIMDRANALTNSMLAGIERRKERLAAQSGLLNGVKDGDTARGFQQEQEQRAQALAETWAACAAFGEDLGRLTRVLEMVSRDANAA